MEINDKNLKFLDFILIELSKTYPDGSVLYFLSLKYEDKTGIVFDKLELETFFNIYKDKYFLSVQNTEYIIIHPDYIGIIKRYGSLSSEYNRNKRLATIRTISKIITQYVLPVILLAISLYFARSSDNNKSKIHELDKVIKTKDSIINDLEVKYDKTLIDSTSKI